jgi:multicomponent Na+:H+ antiporter subunit A
MTAGLFGWAPILLAGYLTLSLLAPVLVRAAGRNALLFCAVLPALTTVWVAWQLPDVLAGGSRFITVPWVPTLALTIDLRLDALSAILTLVVGAVGTGVFVYSARYFPAGDEGIGRYAAALVAFCGAMFGLVLADNLILLVIFWELTGLLSYLLIAHRTGKRSSRRAAQQAFLVTTAGGLALLVGAVLLGVHAGTFLLSEILANPPRGTTATAAVVLMLVGGLSKSALIPFQFWLPGAMAAPTPASAYLHAATMVKAGVYLFARLAPAFGGLAAWQPVLVVLGGLTMLYGGVVALRQWDLKLLLAYGTVSQLGLMTMLIGSGNPDALLGGLVVLLAHAAFKSTLFFVVGVIDIATGTRDLTKLTGLRRAMPALFWIAVAAAASMGGLPPTIGFVAKEAGFAGLLAGGGWGVAAVPVMVLGSALTVAYSLRFLWGAFADKSSARVRHLDRQSRWTTGPAAALAAVGIVLGLGSQYLEPLVQSHSLTAGLTHPEALGLWHGVTLPLVFSLIGWLLGAAIFTGQRRSEVRTGIAKPTVGAGAYAVITAGVDRIAVAVTSATQRGSLPVSLGAVLVVLVAFPGTMLIRSGAEPEAVNGRAHPAELVLGLIAIAVALMLTRVRRPLSAVLLIGGVGYAVAAVFIVRGAPDLALTQVLVETVTVVACLLVLTRLPDTAMYSPRKGNWVRFVVAAGVGVLMTALALTVPNSRVLEPVSTGLGESAVNFGGGANIVNVILVDTRGWDTLGEITVLISAATGVASLIFIVRRTGSVPRRPSGRTGRAVPKPNRPSPYLTTDWWPQRSLLLEVVTRLIFHVIVLFSVYVLLVGHNEPGGGFAGGLIVGLALTLRYLAGGAFELGEAIRVDAGTVLGTGLLLAVTTAAYGLIAEGNALQSTIFSADLPILGELKLVTSTVFDIGVYLVVIGLVLDVLRSMGAELDQQDFLRRSIRPSDARVATTSERLGTS